MRSLVLVVVVVFIIIVIFLVAQNDWLALVYQKDMLTRGADAATALFVVAVFLERSIAVINNLIFGNKIAAAELQLQSSDLTARTAANAEISTLGMNQEQVRLVLGFVFAVLVSAAGARTLESLLELPPPSTVAPVKSAVGAPVTPAVGAPVTPPAGIAAVPPPNQRTLFHAVDILLTAGLLAGGSNALALIIALLKKKVNNVMTRLNAERLAITNG